MSKKNHKIARQVLEALGIKDVHEPLMDELKPYFHKAHTWNNLPWPMLHHPLVVQYPFIHAAFANTTYRQKKEIMDQALKDRDWPRVFIMLERPYRLSWLEEFYYDGTMSKAEVRKYACGIWSDAEPDDTSQENIQFWLDICEDASMLRDNGPLPHGEPLVVYRGILLPKQARGLSWTLDRNVAYFFAHRFAQPGMGHIVTAKANRKQVLAYITQRGESELIINPIDPYDLRMGDALVPMPRKPKKNRLDEEPEDGEE